MSSLLVCGTSSDAGKSVIVAGLCRYMSDLGIKVAPFKAQNMSLNSAVTQAGEEIGRAQAAQAFAARIEPEAVSTHPSVPGLKSKPCTHASGTEMKAVCAKPFSARHALTRFRSRLRLPWLRVVPGT